MSANWGNVPANSVIPFFFDAFAGSTGASITMTGIAVTDIEIFKGVSMTQRASDNGYTLLDTDGIDVDGITGIHGFSIDTSDNSDAGFYAAGSFYTVVVASVTIDSQTVNFIAGTFRLVAAEAVAGKPKVDVDALLGTAWLTPGTAGTPDVNVKLWNALTTVALPLVPTVAGRSLDVSAGGEAGVDWANVGTPGSTVSLSATTIATLTTYTGNTPQTGDSFARIGAAGAGLTAVPWNAAWDAEVESEVDDALGGGTGTALTGIPWNAAWDAEVQSEVADELDTTVADSVPADGTRPSLRQAAYMVNQFLLERSVSGTTVTVKKVDGTSSLMTFTLNDGTTPTSITRAT